MEKEFYKHVPLINMMFVAGIYARECTWESVVGLFLGLAFFISSKIEDENQKMKSKILVDQVKAIESLNLNYKKLDKSHQEVVKDFNKQFESLRTAIQLKQLGR